MRALVAGLAVLVWFFVVMLTLSVLAGLLGG
jgi:hypothetical protein